MCIIVYEYCSICKCNAKSIYRCISKSQISWSSPCEPLSSIDKPSMYPIVYRCFICFSAENDLDESKKYFILLAQMHVVFAKLIVELNDNTGYLCLV